MDLRRMLDKCHREQWSIRDLELSSPPAQMPRDEEEAIVQYFTDMAGIERLAAALFTAQRDKVDDPVLKQIFTTFIDDEVRHSHAAQLLADHYDVHKHRVYQPNPHLTRFTPAFVDLIQLLTPEVANTYITTGEIILDVALLRSLADHVGDETVHGVMQLINRDESRHIAIDFHMVEFYCSDEWQRIQSEAPSQPLSEQAHAWLALIRVLFYARPFFRHVFFEPMERCDPTGRRIKEAFKRIQLLGAKPNVRRRPFSRFMLAMQDLYNTPVVGKALEGALVRIVGIDPQVLRILYTEDEARHARAASFEQLAQETLALKYA